MPLDAIKITVKSVDIPDSWITAEEANEIATSIKNKNFATFINRIMEVIKVAAEEGRTSCGVYKHNESTELVQRALSLLHSLGYEVSNNSTSISISW